MLVIVPLCSLVVYPFVVEHDFTHCIHIYSRFFFTISICKIMFVRICVCICVWVFFTISKFVCLMFSDYDLLTIASTKELSSIIGLPCTPRKRKRIRIKSDLMIGRRGRKQRSAILCYAMLCKCQCGVWNYFFCVVSSCCNLKPAGETKGETSLVCCLVLKKHAL